MSHEDVYGADEKSCGIIRRQLRDCLDRPLHPYISGAIGTAILAMDYVMDCVGDGAEMDNEEIILGSCQNLLGYTMSFAESMKSWEFEELKRTSEEIAKVIFGPERTRSAAELVKEGEVIFEMELSGRLN
jgi:hypothetical protein